MSKITSSSADYQTSPTLFELEPVAGKKVTVDFSAPELSSLGGLTLVREYEKSSSRIIERIESCIKEPRWEPMVIHSQTEMLRQRIYQIMAGFEDADDCDIYRRHKPNDGPNISHVTPTGKALLHSALEKSRNPMPSGHLPVLLSGTSDGF